MRESIAADHPFEFSEETPDVARARLAEQGQDFKVEDTMTWSRRRSATGRRCRRRPSTDRVRSSTSAAARMSRAPARSGRSSCSARPVPTGGRREAPDDVYGTAWATQEELDAYLWRREEARKRDHRRLGVALDLFSFHDVVARVGLLAPEGATSRHPRGLDARAPARRGYQEVSTPILVSEKLWRQSGHWISTATTCSWSSPRTRRSASSR